MVVSFSFFLKRFDTKKHLGFHDDSQFGATFFKTGVGKKNINYSKRSGIPWNAWHIHHQSKIFGEQQMT